MANDRYSFLVIEESLPEGGNTATAYDSAGGATHCGR